MQSLRRTLSLAALSLCACACAFTGSDASGESTGQSTTEASASSGVEVTSADAGSGAETASSGESSSADTSSASGPTATDGTTDSSTTGTSEGTGDSSTTGPIPGDLVVATYNVRRLFNTQCDSGDCGPSSFEEVPSQAEFDARIAELRDAILLVDADVVLLQEIETQVVLDALANSLGNRYPGAELGELGYAASLDVGILAAVPIDAVFRHSGDQIPLPGGGETWFTREFLEVQIDWQGRRVALFTGHFKSKQNDDPQRRLAEARAAEAIVTQRAAELPNGVVIFGGDLNDVPNSAPIDAIEASGTLLRVASDAPDDSTTYYNSEGEAIDHIFISSVAGAAVYVPGSSEVIKGSFWGLGGSDHAVLRAAFEFTQ